MPAPFCGLSLLPCEDGSDVDTQFPSKFGPSGADYQVGGFVYIPGPCGSLQQTLLWGWEFLLLPQPLLVFKAKGFWGFISHRGTSAPQLFLLVYLHTNVGLSHPPDAVLPMWSSSCHLAARPLHPSFQSPTLLPVWKNVSSLTPWLLDFHTILFSGSSGCFFVFKFVIVCLLVVQGGKVYLPMPPSWLQVPILLLLLLLLL